MRVRLEWKPNDCWVGVYWRKTYFRPTVDYRRHGVKDIWICLLPMLPIHISYRWMERGKKRGV